MYSMHLHVREIPFLRVQSEFCVSGDSNVVRARMRTEIESEKKRLAEAETASQAARSIPKEVTLDGSPMLPTVLYCCPEIGSEVLPKDDLEAYISEFLLNR